MSCDWSDGFLFIGNKLSLDFLNTRPLMAGAPLELLPDCASLARWLKAAGLLSKREGKRLERKWSARPAFAGMVRELREFREELRQTVLEMEAGAPPPAAFIAKANELL